jgi:hypothetical protein
MRDSCRFALANSAVLLRVAAFVVLERFLRLRGFSVLPVTASTMLVAALETPSFHARFGSLSYDVQNASFFSLSIVISLRDLCDVTLSFGSGQWVRHQKLCKSRDPRRYFWNTRILHPVIGKRKLGG